MPTVDLQSVIGVANPLRRWRVHNNVTQADLGAALDVSASQISQWEKHRSVPTLERFHRLLRHTGLSAHVLLRFFAPLPTPHGEVVVVQFPGLKRSP
jgi:transcriptional regulator with XRE-family HTH domain